MHQPGVHKITFEGFEGIALGPELLLLFSAQLIRVGGKLVQAPRVEVQVVPPDLGCSLRLGPPLIGILLRSESASALRDKIRES